MSVVKSVEETGPSRVKVTIEVPAPAVEAELGRVLKDIRSKAQIHGFRPGKVPMSVVRKRFRKEAEGEVLDRLLPRYWQQAEAEKGFEPLLAPQLVEEPKLEEGEPLLIVAEIETRPEIILADLDNFELPEDDAAATNAEIDEALVDLRRSHGEWQEVDRPAAQGDVVLGRVIEETDADADEEPEDRPLHIEIGADNVDEELSLALTGASAGQTIIYTQKHPAGAHGEGEEEGEAHEHRYQVTVEEVDELQLPELDDELAKKVGDFDSVDELRDAVREGLGQRKTRDLADKRKQSMLDQLRQRYPITLPQGLVQHESEQMVQHHAQRLAQQGIDVEKAEINWEAMLDDIRPMAERKVHDQLLLDAIAKHEELSVDAEEFERVLTAIAAQEKLSSAALRHQLSESGRLQQLRNQLLRDQTVLHLLGEGRDEEGGADGDADADGVADAAKDSAGDGDDG